MKANTLFLRLAGPMQSWGTSSRFQLRRTDAYPSKSGALGLLLCAKGVRREDSAVELRTLSSLTTGVRVDRPGILDWDYHTAGGGHGNGPHRAIGIRRADGKIKKTASTGEYETLLSRRQYLSDASFLVALHGDPAVIGDYAKWLHDPIWPVFLGRKCCVPTEPVFAGTGEFDSPTSALASVPWQPRIAAIDGGGRCAMRQLDCYIEHPPGSAPPDEARLVHDVPRGFGYYNYTARFVVFSSVTVPVGEPLHPPKGTRMWVDPYGPGWDDVRRDRLEFDKHLCVFCKSPAVEVHHLDYADVRRETTRSLCKLCHEVCTSLEYGKDMRHRRIDPTDPEQRQQILAQIERLQQNRRFSRRAELLEAGRAQNAAFFDDTPVS
ncbi:type I-E CRISPR-associated protein Cas5/CasD [Anaerobaca lacustris]|uniref:Type I-E CRISPR-associated protein Cas5/CasD n=1 Tax=Anaerobaca lacustris TaxID=3044600 RepID=A0AAW6TXU4_9BACT|nr:type I-E CRISPR-associated protein Cas5/CasD [Sedimentisphaerales bacterium M17dextr]